MGRYRPTSPYAVRGAAVTETSPPAARLRQPSWLDRRLLLGVALILTSIVVGANVVRAADKTVSVWKTTRALPAGSMLRAEDVEATRVRLFGSDQSRYVDAEKGAAPTGLVVSRDLGAGELLPASALVEPDTVAPTRLVTIPIDRSHALGGRLARGDRVDVVATFRAGANTSETRAVVKAALVEDVVDDDGGFGAGSGFAVIVRVGPEQALALTSALQTAELDLLLVQGAGAQVGDIGDGPVSGGPARTPAASPSPR